MALDQIRARCLRPAALSGLFAVLLSTTAAAQEVDPIEQLCASIPPDETSELVEHLLEARTSGTDRLLDCLASEDRGKRNQWYIALKRVPAAVLELGSEVDQELLDLRQVSLTIIRRVGDADLWEPAYALAFDEAQEQPLKTLQPALREATESILERDAREALETLDQMFDGLHPRLRLDLVRALGSQAHPDSIDVLAGFLDRDANLEVTLLSQLSRVAGAVDVLPSTQARMRVRLRLTATGAAVRREAAAVLGRFNDYESVQDLIELLDDPDRGVRGNAHWSLRHITGKPLDDTSKLWVRWFEAESEWWREKAPDLLDQLGSSQTAEIVGALNQIGRKRLFRDELATEVELLLTHEDPEVIRMACSVLTSLKSRVPLPGLVRLLEHPVEAVRESAQLALNRITGKRPEERDRAWGGSRG